MRTENKIMWQSTDIAQATKGKLQGAAFAASSITIDSRKVQKGALFVALKGEHADGHEHVKSALAAAAAGALVQRLPEGLGADAPLILVNDTYKALVDIAIASRRRTAAQIIAVTGSVGKTGTKEALRTILASGGNVYATQGNLNNHIGLPLSLANLPEDARFGIFELGMNHAREIAFLTRIARPHIAVITNVEAVHLEFFSGLDAIADAKAEILEGMNADGTLILNRDNAQYDRLLRKARARSINRIVTFGAHEQADCRLTGYAMQELGSRVEAVINGTPITYLLGSTGRHWALTSLAALAAASAAGADLADSAAELAYFHEPEGRGKLRRIEVPGGFVTLIDDCYNASPASTKTALEKLAEVKATQGSYGRAVAALGDMLELGVTGPELHSQLSEPIMKYQINKVYLAGPLMKHLYKRLPEHVRGAHASSSTALAPQLAADILAGDVVLVKGSRGSRMDIIRDALAVSFPSRPVKASVHVV